MGVSPRSAEAKCLRPRSGVVARGPLRGLRYLLMIGHPGVAPGLNPVSPLTRLGSSNPRLAQQMGEPGAPWLG
jgi:hypothetical protein